MLIDSTGDCPNSLRLVSLNYSVVVSHCLPQAAQHCYVVPPFNRRFRAVGISRAFADLHGSRSRRRRLLSSSHALCIFITPQPDTPPSTRLLIRIHTPTQCRLYEEGE